MTIKEIILLRDTTGFDVVWENGLPLSGDTKDAVFYASNNSWVCTVKKNGFAVDVYCDGDTWIKTRDGNGYRYGDELIAAGYTDKKLGAAEASDEITTEMNSWFDLYVQGEHLDCVSHDIDDALASAQSWLDEEIENAKQIEIGVPVDLPAITDQNRTNDERIKMHVGQIMLVEAESHAEAVDKVQGVIQYSETPTPSWSDWNEIGGRWSGFFGKGKNVLRYTENSALAEEKLTEWLRGREEEMASSLNQIKTLDLAKVVAEYDPEKEPSWVGDTSMALWRLARLARLLGDDWTSDSGVYDLDNFTGNLKSFRERLAVAPEMQYLVIVDFHHQARHAERLVVALS